MKFQTISVDFPWPEIGGGVKGGRRGADRHYDLMSLKEIQAFPIPTLADENCHLYMWVTANYLDAGVDLMRSFGFRYKRPLIWVKSDVLGHTDWRHFNIMLNNPGLGQYFRGVVEICLFGVKGVLPYKTREDGKRAQGLDVVFAPRTKHSEKPEEMRKIMELVSHGPRLELFARKRIPDWYVWGNEVSANIVIDKSGEACVVDEVEVGLTTEIKAQNIISSVTQSLTIVRTSPRLSRNLTIKTTEV